MKRQILAAAFLIAATGAAAGPAAGYTSYILPADFSPENRVTLEAAFASTFFTPAVGLPADMKIYFPDGAEATFDRVEVAGATTALSAELTAWGTYRVSTGERLGPVSTLVEHEGGWRQLAQGETPAEGLQTTTLQSVTSSDTYLSRGAPTRTNVDRTIGALALHPITHPNQVLVSTGFEVELQFNGAPFPNMPLVLYKAGDADTNVETFFVTNEAGRATITFAQPGNYVIAARYRGAAPANSGAAVRSYTTTLTFEVITALPDYPPTPAVEVPRRRRSTLRPG